MHATTSGRRPELGTASSVNRIAPFQPTMVSPVAARVGVSTSDPSQELAGIMVDSPQAFKGSLGQHPPG